MFFSIRNPAKPAKTHRHFQRRRGRIRTNGTLGRIAVALLVLLAGAAPGIAAQWRFDVQFSPTVRAEPYNGRVYIFFSRLRSEPRDDPDWFFPEAFVARDVVQWKPGDTLVFGGGAQPEQLLAYPHPLSELTLAGYRAQAVVRFNPFERKIGSGPGNGYSQVVGISAPGRSPAAPLLVVDRLVPARKFRETERRKEFQVRSRLLSAFHGREIVMKAAVALPARYLIDATRRYPTIFEIPGFGGTHYVRSSSELVQSQLNGPVEFLRVTLDPSCPLGHHVFADSENNGPVGTALVTEFLPAFDAAFRSVADPRARFLTGHSSGGWSSLWLQVTYPDHFGGTWSTSPDPVDFRDFQRIDVYRPGENMYLDRNSRERPLARVGSQVVLYFRGFANMEWILGPGGQLHSFEAVFSPRGPGGKPRLLWDRATGEIHSDVAKSWDKYDIRLTLERNWKSLAPKLAGKIHVFMGSDDTFYLDGATRLLKTSLKALGSDADIEIVPGRDHFTLLDGSLIRRIYREMAEAYLKSFPR